MQRHARRADVFVTFRFTEKQPQRRRERRVTQRRQKGLCVTLAFSAPLRLLLVLLSRYREVHMQLIVVLLALALSFPLAAAPLRLATDVVPRAQSISLTIDPARDDYSGIVVVDLDVR